MKKVIAALAIMALFTGCVSLTANTQTGSVSYTRMFESQNIAGLTIEKEDGKIRVELKKLESASNDQQILSVINSVVNAGR